MLDSNLSLDPHIYNISRGTVFVALGSTQLWALQYYWGLLLVPLTVYLMIFVGFYLTSSSYKYRNRGEWEKIYVHERTNIHGQYIYKKQIRKTDVNEFIITSYILVFFCQIEVPIKNIYFFDKYIGDFNLNDIKYIINLIYAAPIILIKDIMFKDGYYRVGRNAD